MYDVSQCLVSDVMMISGHLISKDLEKHVFIWKRQLDGQRGKRDFYISTHIYVFLTIIYTSIVWPLLVVGSVLNNEKLPILTKRPINRFDI